MLDAFAAMMGRTPVMRPTTRIIVLRVAGGCAKCKKSIHWWNGVVAQLVERLVRNEKVRGSTPLGSTISPQA